MKFKLNSFLMSHILYRYYNWYLGGGWLRPLATHWLCFHAARVLARRAELSTNIHALRCALSRRLTCNNCFFLIIRGVYPHYSDCKLFELSATREIKFHNQPCWCRYPAIRKMSNKRINIILIISILIRSCC